MIKNILHLKTTGFAIVLMLFAWFKTEWFDASLWGIKALYIVIVLIGVLLVIPDTFVNALKGLIDKKSKEM